MVAKVLEAIGNVVESAEVGGVLYTLAADRVVRVNDADTGLIVHRHSYPLFSQAEAAYRGAVADARKAEGA
jgi:D-tyrosyl-tRNA(Tyr) deacylase